MSDGFVIATFKHVADGLQEGQFAVGERTRAATLDDLDPEVPLDVVALLLDQPAELAEAVGHPLDRGAHGFVDVG